MDERAAPHPDANPASPADAAHARDEPILARTPDDQVTAYFQLYAPLVVGHLTNVSALSREDAEEIAQETFLRLHTALVAGERIAHPKAWLFTVARRLMLNLVKERRGHAIKLRQIMHALELVVRHSLTAEDELRLRQQHAALNRAWAELSGIERECFDLRVQGFKLREVAPMVGLDLRRVSEAVRRATDRLHAVVNA